MKLLAEIMKKTIGYPVNCWWLNGFYSNVIDKASKLGFVKRTSTTQVFWTEKGVNLYHKYIG